MDVLGLPHAAGFLTAGFGCKVLNGSGNDVRVYEVTNGSYPYEQASVEASMDGTTWVALGMASNTGAAAVRTTSFDLGSLPYAIYVRVTNMSNPSGFEGTADAFDLDGIAALQDCVDYRYETAWADGPRFVSRGN